MLSRLRLQASNPAVVLNSNEIFAGTTDFRCNLDCRSRRDPPFSPLTVQSRSDAVAPRLLASEPSCYSLAFGSSLISSSLQLPHWNLTQRHVTILNVIACVTAICATWLFCSAIPTLLAFRRAAESLEKLVDARREELPGTMAAIRLSGMEISDLTMELSDLGSSTRAVRLAEERLQLLSNMSPSVSSSLRAESGGSIVAKTARSMREGIVKGRAILQIFFTLARFSSFAFNFIMRRRKS